MFKIKLIPTLLAIALLAICSSCDENESVMTINESKLVMASGANRSILIEGGHPEYSVVSRSENIVTASIINDILIINALQPGETILTLFDAESSIVVIPITVHPYSNQTILEIDSLYISTIITDPTIKQIIENELNDGFLFPVGTRYVLGFKAEEPGDLLIYPNANQVIEGTFNVEKADERLNYIFTYENKTITYQIDMVNMTTAVSSVEIAWISLTEDLTEYYKQVYPDAGVEKVLRMQLTMPETISFD